MNPLVIGALVGAGLGYMQNKDEKKNFKEEQKLNAIKARFSPWTNIHPTNPRQPQGLLAGMGKGAVGGMLTGQAIAAGMGEGPEPAAISGSEYAALEAHGGPTIEAQNALNGVTPPTPQQEILMQHGGPTNAAAAQANGMADYNPYGYPYMNPYLIQQQQSPWVSMSNR